MGISNISLKINLTRVLLVKSYILLSNGEMTKKNLTTVEITFLWHKRDVIVTYRKQDRDITIVSGQVCHGKSRLCHEISSDFKLNFLADFSINNDFKIFLTAFRLFHPPINCKLNFLFAKKNFEKKSKLKLMKWFYSYLRLF